ncbi:hemerythrin domain-containing protein [Streptomyces sp. WAC06614]|uniref:hemerythrin domain-containing protein n=1 Tax=Streptomyces sp. WAC06614 TaxID=2487416 RepID=UPI000F79FABE|nr:hemerythrin domain-containing protein [Streptomyces sp. WAC06614]RSS83107.1 hemerythrin domain-containing protein [Streptomyces sp. WAC06614]
MNANNPSDTTVHPYTREMAMIHQVFRRESRLLAELVQEVRPGDTARSRILAEHWRLYSVGLHTHHTGEDEMLWPVLLPHLDLDAEQVLAMEAQHHELSDGIAEVQQLMDLWQDRARPEDRDALAEALRRHHRQLCAHLDEEEREVMPLVALHVTAEQWHAIGERGLAETPRNRLMIALGAILEDASPEEREEFLGRLPLPARVLWKLLGQRQYRRETTRVRGRRTTV